MGSHVSAINVHTESKLKSPVAKVTRSQTGSSEVRDPSVFGGVGLDEDFDVEDIEDYSAGAGVKGPGVDGKKVGKEGKEKEKKKPWYKEYVR